MEVIELRDILVSKRRSMGYTQKQVAQILGISEVYVRKIEKGKRNPGRDTMLKFEILYNTPSEVLFPDLFQVLVDTERIKNLDKEVS